MATNRLRKLEAARAASKPALSGEGTNGTWLVVLGVGLLPFTLLVLLALIVILALLLSVGSGSQMTMPPDPSTSGLPGGYGSMAIELAGGDGRGAFAAENVPDDELVEPIVDAADQCDLLTPVIIAAQIEYASGFDTNKEGPRGRKGLSQLTPEVFREYGEDDDGNGKTSAFDPEDSIFAHARYFCHLADETQLLLEQRKAVGDHLTLTLLAWEIGLEAVEAVGGMPIIDLASYPFVVRGLFARYSSDAGSSSTKAPSANRSTKPTATAEPVTTPTPEPVDDSAKLSMALFEELFPGRNSFYTYAGLTDAMARFPAFAATGDQMTRMRELAAFLATVDHESGGLVHIEEINRSAWGNYCDAGQPYGCPAGRDAYHGRGPIQLSWNTNYKAAGDALNLDLLNEPDLVKTNPSVAWQTALWFWMTQTGAGSMTAHAAMTGGRGFGETIRTVNGALECGGRAPDRVRNRIDAYKRIARALGAQPEEEGRLTC